LEAGWEEGFSYLKAYKEREGQCCPPIDQKENGFRLGQWVAYQRNRAEAIPAIRRRQLDELNLSSFKLKINLVSKEASALRGVDDVPVCHRDSCVISTQRRSAMN